MAMTDTLWADVSEFQKAVDATYPYRWLSIRSNDGTYRDAKFLRDYQWCVTQADAGKLDGFFVYAVYEPDNENWAKTMMAEVGAPHPRMVAMIDTESWGGRITGDRSADINAGRAELSKWLGDDARVVGYGNAGDLGRLWPNRGTARIILANYDDNPSFPGKFAHQYTDHANVPPFGSPVDMNSADGLSSAQLQTLLGITGGPAPADVNPAPAPDIGYNTTSWTTKEIQHALNVTQDAGLVEDDIYGPKTTEAVHAFEVKYGLTVDIGVAGPQVVGKLKELVPKPTETALKVDGELGPKTITRWQEVMGTTVDGVISDPSELVEAVQRTLNDAGAHDKDGRKLVIDGRGIEQNGVRTHTIYALQVYLGTPRDGIMSVPVSDVVKALQKRLNTGRF